MARRAYGGCIAKIALSRTACASAFFRYRRTSLSNRSLVYFFQEPNDRHYAHGGSGLSFRISLPIGPPLQDGHHLQYNKSLILF